MSSLQKLNLFLNSLPNNKVIDEWDERYIDYVDDYSNYANLENLARARNRIVDESDPATDIWDDGYSSQRFKDLCNIPVNTCHQCCDKDETVKNGCKYDSEKCSKFFAKNVHNWSELCDYHILFLKGEVPGTPGHPGPWNKETQYIIQPLIEILNSQILTLDSQPGLLMINGQDGNLVQKPYIEIGGPVERIHKILATILTDNQSIIKFVRYNRSTDEQSNRMVDILYRMVDVDNYQNWEDGVNYVSVFLGIDTPEILTDWFIDWVLSNRFYDEIAKHVQMS